jgi:serine protease Do
MGVFSMNKIKRRMVMKKIGSVLICLILIFASMPATFAETPIKILIDGKLQTYDQSPIQESGSVMVPMRGIFESLGATLEWDTKTQTVSAYKGNTIIVITIGNNSAYINGSPVKLAIKAQSINGRTLVPLRFVSEALGGEVIWDGTNRTVLISTKKMPAVNPNLTTKEIVKLNDSKIFTIYTSNDKGPLGLGSGFAIADGLILTNFHVIAGANKATVKTVDGKSFEVEGVVLYDEKSDLAIIKTQEKIGIEPVTLGMDAEVEKGDHVVAIGSPKGLSNTVSEGIVSNVLEEDGIAKIQISVPITHGSSGGALFNEQGKVIGVTTSGLDTNADLNFAVSIRNIEGWKNEYTKPFETLVTEWPKITGGLETAADMETLLNNDFTTIPTSFGNIELNSYEVVTDDVGLFYIVFNTIRQDQYENYKNNYSLINNEVNQWTTSLSKTLSSKYPDKRMIVVISYENEYTYNPIDQFEKKEIEYMPDQNKWYVNHPIIAAIIDNGEFQIDSRP